MSFITLISKDDIIHHLVSTVPCVQFLVQWAVSQLGGVRVHVRERQAWYSVCERVRIKGVCHVGVATLHTIYCVKHATHQEGVAVATTTETCSKGLYCLKVSGMEVDEQDYFLVEALCVKSGVKQPQARLIYSQLHLQRKKRRE